MLLPTTEADLVCPERAPVPQLNAGAVIGTTVTRGPVTVTALLTTALTLELVTVATEVSHPAKEIQFWSVEAVTKA